MLKNIYFKILFLIIFITATSAFAVDLDFDADNDTKIDTTYLDFSHDITGAVECNGAGACEQAEYEDLSNYNALDPDYLSGDTTDDNLIDVGVINTAALKVTLSTDDLWTLSGRTEGSTHLGTFTGAILTDNISIKAAFQELETEIEGLGGGHDPVTLGTNLNSNLLGISTQELTLDAQSANLIFAGPSSGGAAVPSFRSLVAADIPDISATYEVQLVNEAGLYAVLSDVSDFHQPGDTLRTNSGTSLPGTCTVGDMFLDTDADTDGTVYICRATDTWKDIDDDGSTGADVLAKVSSNETDADYLVNQIGSSTGEIDVTETGTGDETLNLAIDVTPSSGSATLAIANDAIGVKYNASDFDEGANGLYIDYTNAQAAASGVKGFLTAADWATFNAKEDETHASEHAVGGADAVFPADPGAHKILVWDDTGNNIEWGTLSDLFYDGSNISVVDDSHNHIYSNIDVTTSANWQTVVSDETGTGAWVFGTSPTFTTNITVPIVALTDEDASLSSGAGGQLKYDNTITGLIDGGLIWWDDDEVQLIVSVPLDNFGTGPTDDYVLCYDAINDEHYYCEASGVGGNTKFNLIADADADGEIELLGYEQTITTTLDESGGVQITYKHTDSDGITNDFYFAEYIHVNDGDAQAHFIRGLDNTSDELWKIAYDGTIYAKAFETTGTSTIPGFTAKDADCPGSDKEIGKLTWNYLSGADGAEDGSISAQVMIAGTERTIFHFDADTEAMTLGDENTGEDLVFDFDTGVANEIGISSNSGVTVIDFGTINIEADQFESDIATGTAPFIVASTTPVANLTVSRVYAQTPDIATPSSWTMSGDPLYGGTFIASGSSTATLPAVAAGMNFSVKTESTNVATLDPNGSETIYLNGTSCTAGFTIYSSGTAGDMAVFQYRSSGVWSVDGYGFSCGS